MHPVIKVINAVLVRTFYERHAGLLFLVFYLMFGVVEPGQITSYHLALIYGTLSSPVMMAIVFIVWFLYLVKGGLFFDECISQPQNLFFRSINLLNKRDQFFLFVYAYFIVYQPVLIYSVFMIALGFSRGVFLQAIGIIVFHGLAISACSWRSVLLLNNSRSSQRIIQGPFHASLPLFYLGLLTSRFRIMLLLTKIASILCILGFLRIPVDEYEPRLAFLGMVTAITSYAVIIFEWRQFEDYHLQFTRTLPIKSMRRFLTIACAYAILLLPEFIVLLVQKIYPWDAILAILLGLGFALFAHGSLYKEPLNNDRHLQRILVLFLLIFLLALSKLALPAAILLIAGGWWRFHKNFAGYEPMTKVSEIRKWS